jgi:glycosyltransferase involved in cell wall biosynthesis
MGAHAQLASSSLARAKAPRVSIGMPVYNAERYLAGTLGSILAQSFRDFELIISDNGSIDRTEQICREYASHDSRICYVRHEVNRGAAWNHNYALSLACGEFFKWNSYDDRLAPSFLEKCVAVLDRTPEAVLCFSEYVDIDANGNASCIRSQPACIPSPLEILLPRPHERFRRLIQLDHNCVEVYGLIRLAVLRKTPGIAPYAVSDRVLLVELALRGVFAEVPEVLFFHGWHGKNMDTLYPDARDQHVWFNPDDRGRLIFPHWRVLQEYLRLSNRVSLPWKERILCYGHLLRWQWRFRGHLRRDFSRLACEALVGFAKKYCPWLQTPWRMWKALLSNLIAFAKKYCPWLRTPWRLWKALMS